VKETTININGQPFSYMDEAGDPYVFEPWQTGDADALMQLTDRLLRQCGIDYFLAFGTLLGAVREGNFIKGDLDIDIIVTNEERLFESLPFLYKKGLLINRIFPEELYTFHSANRHGHIDLYVMKDLDKHHVTIQGHRQNRKYFKTILPDGGGHTLAGKTYPCPANPERLLIHWYGRNWRIPQDKQANINTWYETILKYHRRVIRKAKKILRSL